MMPGLTANSADKEAHIDDFEILHTIGEGTFGKVKLARHILTGTQVAVKVIKKRRQSFSSVQAVFREVCSLKALNHPNIVKLLGVTDTEETFFVVLEYLSGGDMYRYLKIHGRMTEAEARGPFQQLVSALQHCHERGIVHRDLKPLNLLFDSNMNIKLTDFGLSNECDDTGQADTICGTHRYAAPELFLGQSYSGPAVDVWSLGAVLYTMVTGSQPFVGKDFQELRKQILQGQYPIPPYLSLEIRDLLRKMIALNPSDRGTLPDLMRHPWVNMGQKEPLQPPCEEDLEVTMVRTPGLTCDQIQDTGTGSVSPRKPKVGVSIITVMPFSSGDLSGSELEPSPSPVVSSVQTRWLYQRKNVQLQEDQQAGQKTGESACPPPSLEARTATPSPAPQCGTGTSTSSSSRIGAPEGTSCPLCVSNPGRSSHTGQPESVSSSTLSGYSQKKQGVAGRIWNFILKHLCCKLPSKRRRNKVSPCEPHG
ncbi:serine/threonine-protein kinase MARK2-like [Eubalaena glacialis]|uniref:serine/threonine-protein kinase MARK2-like n=1 Tax=Eubalaena glacialis TaxID=27606 RepID=UPI002A5AB731|nr:serine/threonine-protein kinase MARK2-like [Eubalaena glacialis]